MQTRAAGVAAFVPAEVARRFVAGRREATALPGYPADRPPHDLAEAYAVQDAALTLWPDRVVGWKLGRIADDRVAELGAGRVAGPIFHRALWIADGAQETPLPVIDGGFAAVEAEFVFRTGIDVPAGRLRWTLAEAEEVVDALFAGVELAGSPLATINELGPTVVASDFGNNAGLVLGPRIADWRERLDDLTCTTEIEGEVVGRGGAGDIPNGPLDSVRFLLEHLAERGLALPAGSYVSAGAATGVHDIRAGQHARIVFDGVGEIRVRAEAAGRTTG